MAFAKYRWEGNGKCRGINAFPAISFIRDLHMNFASYKNIYRGSLGKIGS